MRKFDKLAFIPDVHVPYQDKRALNAALKFVQYYKPDTVFLLGDVLDMYGLARFDNKDPEKIGKLHEEIDEAQKLLTDIRDVSGKSDVYYIQGNHEYRLQKYIRNNAPELHGFNQIQLENLLGLDDLNITYVPEGRMEYYGMLVKHGEKVRSRSGYTATGELESTGISGISGHTHRLAQVYKTNRAGMFTWVEAGCVCDLNPEYMEGRIADWQHGMAYGTFTKDRDRRFELHTLPIIHGKVVFEGKEIKA